jgi:hypothetical protein
MKNVPQENSKIDIAFIPMPEPLVPPDQLQNVIDAIKKGHEDEVPTMLPGPDPGVEAIPPVILADLKRVNDEALAERIQAIKNEGHKPVPGWGDPIPISTIATEEVSVLEAIRRLNKMKVVQIALAQAMLRIEEALDGLTVII